MLQKIIPSHRLIAKLWPFLWHYVLMVQICTIGTVRVKVYLFPKNKHSLEVHCTNIFSPSNEIILFKLRVWEDTIKTVPQNSALKPCKQCKCAVVFSKVLSDPFIFETLQSIIPNNNKNWGVQIFSFSSVIIKISKKGGIKSTLTRQSKPLPLMLWGRGWSLGWSSSGLQPG